MKCVICGNEVSKRKSYAYKDGRACKEHREAQEAAEKNKAKETKRVANWKRPKFKSYSGHDDPLIFKPRCFVTGEPGIHQQDYMMRVVVAMHKLDLLGIKYNFFETTEDGRIRISQDFRNKIKNHLKRSPDEGDEVYNCLMIVDIKEYPLVNKHLSAAGRQIADFTGIAAVSAKWLEKQGITIKPKQPEKSVSPEAMIAFAAIMKPVLDEQAVQELKAMSQTN